MAAGSWTNRRTEHAAFELFTRGLPHRRSYLLTAGLEDAVDDFESFHFTHEQIDYVAVARGRAPALDSRLSERGSRFLASIVDRAFPSESPYPILFSERIRGIQHEFRDRYDRLRQLAASR